MCIYVSTLCILCLRKLPKLINHLNTHKNNIYHLSTVVVCCLRFVIQKKNIYNSKTVIKIKFLLVCYVYEFMIKYSKNGRNSTVGCDTKLGE